MDTAFVSLTRVTQLVNTQSSRSRHFRILGAPNRVGYRSCYLPRGFGVRATKCSMKSYRLSELTAAEVDGLKARPRIDFSLIFNVVKPIVDDVQSRGDAAVTDYTAKFDKVVLEKVVEPLSDFPEPEIVVRILSRQLIHLRKQIAELQGSRVKMIGIATLTQAMYSTTSVAPGMEGASKAMKKMNERMAASRQLEVLQNFHKQTVRMDMTHGWSDWEWGALGEVIIISILVSARPQAMMIHFMPTMVA